MNFASAIRPARPLRPFLFALGSVVLLLASSAVSAQCVSLTTLGSAYTQNFDTLSNTAGSTTNNLTITGWFLTETGLGARDNEQYAVDTGGSNTGDTFSYGAAGNTERALGGLQSGTLIPVIGACFTNNTGATITSLAIAYTGEQWRIANTAAARDDRLIFETSTNATSLDTGTWTTTAALNFTNPIKTAGVAGALDGNAAANRTAIAATMSGQSIANGATFWVRWNDLNASGADDGLAIDGFSLTPNGGIPLPDLNVNDVSQVESSAGSTTFTFTVSLTAPAGPGGVTFDIASADGTAQDDNPVAEDNDYVGQSLTGQTIPAGSSTYAFNVIVNGDTTPEPNETFFVNVTNVTGASISDGQGQGTIQNDDVALTPIHDIQGPGNSSPIVGASVTTRGIVTGVKSNGFFIQEPDAGVDADPATSEGILVFVGAAPPAAAAVGNYVQVTATVTEFVPSQDPLQPPLTELTAPTVVQLTTGNPLPAPIPLTASFPDAAGPVDQLERLEGMRVSVASLTASSPTQGNSVDDANATQSSNGVFFGTITGVPRPAREPGIQSPDPAPSGASIPPIPRFDANPEIIRVDSDGLTGAPIIDLDSLATVTGLVGPLDYGFRHYTLLPDPTLPAPLVAGGIAPTAASVPTNREFTVAAYNAEQFYDTVDDPAIGEPVLTATAYDNRLNKVSLGIRNHLRFPDVIGMVEIENLATLQDIAARVNGDAVANAQPDPQYVAYLVEGNDVGGIDVGFLVKNAIVDGATPRITVNQVVQENDAEQFVNPDSSTDDLNDRPPLRLDAVVNAANGASFPITVIVVHQRSLLDINVEGPGANGWPTSGARIRAKRQAQAVSLANLVQARQTADPAETIVLVGDFNAYEFNDGFADVMNVLHGTPPPDNETAVPGDGVDLVNPDLDNLSDTPTPGDRYSYVFDGQMQNIDHAVANAPLVAATLARRVEHPRINTDFRAVDRNDPNTARHLSDHDPLVAYFEVAGFATAALSVTKTDSVDPVLAGQNLSYTIDVTNSGPDPAADVALFDLVPAGTTFVSMSAPAGWSCTTPAVGSGGLIQCLNSSMAVGSASFTLTVAVGASVPAGTVLSNTAEVSTATAQPAGSNNVDTETTTVAAAADLQVAATDTPDPVTAGTNLSYQMVLTNSGPSIAANATFSDTLPPGTSFVSLSTTGGWSCTTPSVGGVGTVSCSNPSFGLTSETLTLEVNVDQAVPMGTVVTNTANIGSDTVDPSSGNNSATATTTVDVSSDLSTSKTLDTAPPYIVGQSVTYTIAIANAGPSQATNILVNDTPSNLTITGVSGACTAIPCTIASLPAGSGTSLTVTATIDNFGFFNNSATAFGDQNDADGTNNIDEDGDIAGAQADVSLTKTLDTAGPYTIGQTVAYTIVVSNAGPSPATDVQITDTPTNLTIANVSGACAALPCTLASLAPGASASIAVTATVDGFGAFDNSATATAAEPDPDPADNSANDGDVAVQSGAVQASKTVSGSYVPGSNVTYTVVLTNAMNAAQIDNVGDEFVDVLPAELTLVSASATAGTAVANAGTNTVSWNGALASGGSVTLTIVATLSGSAADGTVVSNQGTVNYDADGNGSNEASTPTDDPVPAGAADPTTFVVQADADLSVTKSAAPGAVAAGGSLTYNITAANAGPASAITFALTDTLPAGTTFASLTAPAGFSCTTPAVGAGGTITCTQASMPVGNAAFTLVVNVEAGVAGGTVLSNTATVSSASPDPVPADNSATATATVISQASLTGTKTVSGGSAPGSALTYTIVLTNTGSGAQSDNPGNEFTDVLPASLALVSASATSGTAVATVATNTATWNGSIAAGATVTITIQATIRNTAVVGASIVNQGAIAFDADGNGSNEAAAVTDDPGTGAGGDGTAFTVLSGIGAGGTPILVPATSTIVNLMMIALLALGAGAIPAPASRVKHGR